MPTDVKKFAKPPKWYDVYPHGTKEGDEELKFFISIARNPKYQWRSTSALSKESGLSKERVEQIIQKYHKKGMVFQNPKNDDQYGYWEKVPEMLPEKKKSISGTDQSKRIDKLISKDTWALTPLYDDDDEACMDLAKFGSPTRKCIAERLWPEIFSNCNWKELETNPDVSGNTAIADLETAIDEGKEVEILSNSEVAWKELAFQFHRNTEYYRSIVVKIGELFGVEAKTSDDGSIQEDVLCAKVFDLVKELKTKHDYK